MTTLTYHGYLRLVAWYQAQNPKQRVGQAHVNILTILRPDLADEIHASDTLDPFYDDNRLAAYLEHIRQRLPVAPHETELICDRCGLITLYPPAAGGCRCITDPDTIRITRRLVEQRHRKAAERATPERNEAA